MLAFFIFIDIYYNKLIRYGITLVRIWESDASKNKPLVKQKILDAIK